MELGHGNHVNSPPEKKLQGLRSQDRDDQWKHKEFGHQDRMTNVKTRS